MSRSGKKIDALIGSWVRALREAQKIRQIDLAKDFGVSQTMVWKWESASSRISGGTLYRLAEYFDVGIEQFFEGVEELDE
jgi:transcriptional regulator with XRE-family HTH domain